MDNILIKRAVYRNIMDIQNLFSDTISTINAKDYNSEQIEKWIGKNARMKWMLKIKETFFLVALLESKLVGFGSLSREGVIDYLYIHYEHQGEGIATELLERLITYAKNQGITSVTSFVSITAVPFFNSYGFQIIRENTVIRGNVELKNFEMSKSI